MVPWQYMKNFPWAYLLMGGFVLLGILPSLLPSRSSVPALQNTHISNAVPQYQFVYPVVEINTSAPSIFSPEHP